MSIFEGSGYKPAENIQRLDKLLKGLPIDIGKLDQAISRLGSRKERTSIVAGLQVMRNQGYLEPVLSEAIYHIKQGDGTVNVSFGFQREERKAEGTRLAIPVVNFEVPRLELAVDARVLIENPKITSEKIKIYKRKIEGKNEWVEEEDKYEGHPVYGSRRVVIDGDGFVNYNPLDESALETERYLREKFEGDPSAFARARIEAQTASHKHGWVFRRLEEGEIARLQDFLAETLDQSAYIIDGRHDPYSQPSINHIPSSATMRGITIPIVTK